jgi:hypothetical protein
MRKSGAEHPFVMPEGGVLPIPDVHSREGTIPLKLSLNQSVQGVLKIRRVSEEQQTPGEDGGLMKLVDKLHEQTMVLIF